MRSALALLLGGCAAAGGASTPDYAALEIEGWTVRAHRALLSPGSAAGPPALRMLEHRLRELTWALPPAARARLLEVPIRLGLDDGLSPLAEYRPDAKEVVIGSAARFLRGAREQPALLLHEFAHAYHDRVLGFEHGGLRRAYAAAKASGAYASVLRADGSMEAHYALKDEREYFAEGTEAYFSVNDFYPFTRAELERHDPRLFKLLGELWR